MHAVPEYSAHFEEGHEELRHRLRTFCLDATFKHTEVAAMLQTPSICRWLASMSWLKATVVAATNVMHLEGRPFLLIVISSTIHRLSCCA